MIETYSYTDEDQKTWRTFFAAVEEIWAEIGNCIHPWYINNAETLFRFRTEIPSLSELNNLLKKIGWRARYVDGLAPLWGIAHMLHQKILPVSRFIRSREQLFFANEPDLIHDIFGHLPSLLNPDYRRLLEMWSLAAVKFPIKEIDKVNFYLNKQIVQVQSKVATDTIKFLQNAATEIHHFSSIQPSPMMLIEKLYFWIFEFGIIKNNGQYQFFGAGLLSSLSELKKIALNNFSIKPLNMKSVLSPYNISTFQEGYLAAENLGQYEQIIQQILSSIHLSEVSSIKAVNNV